MRTRVGLRGRSDFHLNNRCWIICLRCPYQGHDPSHKRPTEEEVQKEYCKCVPLAAGESNDRRKKVEDEPKAEKGWEEKEEEREIHTSRPPAKSSEFSIQRLSI